ncbi:solute carrier organic anion transporter family member 4C1-like [Branchiostoma lanceolatum]|uniref:solute carrier organic anion transporter family member 4C1-like n=1 Tax=Branchiostoma lanceolatum TaxID=7740 RepID=UPI003456C335
MATNPRSHRNRSRFKPDQTIQMKMTKVTRNVLHMDGGVSAPGFLVAVCLTQLTLGLISDGFISATITTIERRFGLSSSQSGCGSMLYGMPHFLVGPHVYGALESDVCDLQGNSTRSESQVAMGIGATPLVVFGYDLVEISAPSNQGGLYIGIVQTFKGLAVAVGILLGGQLLGLYIDVDKADAIPPIGGVTDPRWLGAWWLGFFLFGAVLLLISVFHGGFTRDFFSATIVPGGVLGSFLSGFLMKKFRVGVKGALKMASVTQCIIVLFTTNSLIRCPNVDFAGVTVPYHDRFAPPAPPVTAGIALLSDCNSNCSCTTYYNPVCGRNGLTFFSPCHAGCAEHDFQKQTYSTCYCVGPDRNTTTFSNSTEPDVVPGYCEKDCGLLLPLLAMVFIWASGLSGVVPLLIFVLLRSVEERQRSMAVGISSVVGRLLGAIPGPILFGALVDRSCLLWGQTCGSGDRGACLLYDSVNMSNYLFAASFTCNFLGLASLLIALYAWKKRRSEETTVRVDPRPLRLSIVMDIKELDSISD